MLPRAVAITGLSKSGMKKALPRTAKLTCEPTATKPAPTRAPVRLWVVEIGNPVIVATITVIAAPIATAVRNSGAVAMLWGTKPLPEKVFTSPYATNIEASEPANVVIVAHQIEYL